MDINTTHCVHVSYMPPRKLKTTTTLIIVESPAKCKKIEECLGPGYKCVATYGHLRTIPSLQHIQIENQFTPTYVLMEDEYKVRQMEVLRKEIKQSKSVILASDADREGEMISYSLIELFGLPLTTPRITFTEITEPALRRAIQHPRTVDMDLVRAQQARQILDVLVGFKVTPSLWKALAPPKGKEHTLSAGRCQTPALKLVYENHLDILRSAETQRRVYQVTGYFTRNVLPFRLNATFPNEASVRDFLERSVSFDHVYACSEPVRVSKAPPEPLTTSRLQQVASNELRWSPKETMSVAQKLYESGYITYMRTDSQTYSDEFLQSVQDHLERTYNVQTLFNEQIREATNDDAHAQEAHEAIRPTDLSLQELPEEADKKEKKLYRHIWHTALESCMVPAIYSKVTATLSAPLGHMYSFESEHPVEPGWQRVADKWSKENKDFAFLQRVAQGSILPCMKATSKASLEGGKAHYTEARLVQLLKDKGIGRPSTYASLVDKIQERGYVKKETLEGRKVVCTEFELLDDGTIQEVSMERTFGQEKDKLVIQPLGMLVMEHLNSHFAPLFEYDYTKHMETSLDAIAKGAMPWVQLCADCNASVDALLERTKDASRLNVALDDNHTFLIGKYGPVVKCVEQGEDGKEITTFKKVRADLDITTLQQDELPSLEEVLDTDKPKAPTQVVLGTYENSDLVLKKGKFGLYVQWKGGTQSRALKELGNRPMESIRREEVLDLLARGNGVLREIGKHASVRKGPKGNYLFYKTPKMKKPQFMDIKTFPHGDILKCPEHVVKAWVEVTYQVKVI